MRLPLTLDETAKQGGELLLLCGRVGHWENALNPQLCADPKSKAPVKSWPANLPLTNCSPRRTAFTPSSSSLLASLLTIYPWAPVPRAPCTTSAEDSWLTKSILDLGESLRICRATSIPFSDGSPMSSRIKSGCSSSAF